MVHVLMHNANFMHISGKILIPLGVIVMILSGVMMYWGGSDGVSSLEDAQIYEGTDVEFELSGYSEGGYLVVVMEGEYESGKDSVGDNGTAVLTDSDCDLVKNFTMSDSDDVNFFMAACENTDDTTADDNHIHIGYICKEGCPDGTYTWETNGVEIQIWDVDMILGGLLRMGAGITGGMGACCCGGFIAIIGLILGFTMGKKPPATGYQTSGVMPQQQGTVHPIDNHPGTL
ncbi:MAG: hypothetical protein CMO20_02010 [Thermoplasmata archaeon]|nr:hypothetical protein [Thermoplasmata archaeon]